MQDFRLTRKSRDPEDADANSHAMASSFSISLGLHLLVIAALVYFPSDFGKPRLPPGAISVSLVSLPGPGPAPGPPAGDGAPPVEKPAPVEAPKPAPVEKPAVSVAPPPPPKPAEVPKPEVSLTPKVKEKKSLKEATRDSQKMIERAIERIEKKVSEPDASSVASAIDRLKKKFAESEPRPGPPAATSGQGGGGGLPGGAGGGGGGPGQIEPIDIYRATVASQVERNWAFSPQLAGGDKNLKVGLVFKVMPNGEISDIRYTERSNNTYLDDSAYKAIVKSSPVAPHPPSVKAPFVTVAIRFTPEGLR
jgi:colicin import membrane protein